MFDLLHERNNDIEVKFGTELEWLRLDEKKPTVFSLRYTLMVITEATG